MSKLHVLCLVYIVPAPHGDYQTCTPDRGPVLAKSHIVVFPMLGRMAQTLRITMKYFEIFHFVHSRIQNTSLITPIKCTIFIS